MQAQVMEDPRLAQMAEVLAAIQGVANQQAAFAARLDAIELAQAQAGDVGDDEEDDPPVDHPVAPVNPAAAPAVVANAPARDLKPLETRDMEKLMGEPTTLQFRLWLRSWRTYEIRMRVHRYPRREQVAAIISCFSTSFLHYYEQNVEPVMTMALAGQPTLDEIIAAITVYVQDQNGGLKDRLAFLQRKQQPGESLEKFWADLQQLGDIAGPCRTCHNATLVNLLTIGVLDKGLRHDLLKERPAPDLPRCLQLCRAHVSSVRDAKAATAATGTSVNVVNNNNNNGKKKFNKKFNKGNNKNASTNASNNATNSNNSSSRKCDNCGRSHADGSCPAKGQTCNYCDLPNHFSAMCHKKKRDTNAPVANVPLVFSSINVVNTTPYADLSVFFCTKKVKFEADVIVDSGAACNVLPMSMLGNFNMSHKDLRKSKLILVGFDGSRRRPLGEVHVRLQVVGHGKIVPLHLLSLVE